MGHIVPSLSFVRGLQSGLEQGLSVLESFEQNLATSSNEFNLKMSLWLSYEKNGIHNQVQFETHYQKHLIEIIRCGFSGSPIYDHLCHLENEMKKEFDRQWKAYLGKSSIEVVCSVIGFLFSILYYSSFWSFGYSVFTGVTIMLMMNFLRLLLIVCFARAEWNKIYESENLDQFLENETKIHFSKRVKESCELEKENQWFPENCLKLWNQSLLEVINPKSEKDYKYLEKNCEEKVEDITEVGKIQLLMELLLPVGCRRALERHKKDLEYISFRSASGEKNKFHSDFSSFSHGKVHLNLENSIGVKRERGYSIDGKDLHKSGLL